MCLDLFVVSHSPGMLAFPATKAETGGKESLVFIPQNLEIIKFAIWDCMTTSCHLGYNYLKTWWSNACVWKETCFPSDITHDQKNDLLSSCEIAVSRFLLFEKERFLHSVVYNEKRPCSGRFYDPSDLICIVFSFIFLMMHFISWPPFILHFSSLFSSQSAIL